MNVTEIEMNKGCAQAVLCYSPTTGGITCTKCNSHAFYGEELKCKLTCTQAIVGFAMTQVEGLVKTGGSR